MTETNRAGAAANRATLAWQEGTRTLLSGYGEGLRRLSELNATFWQPRLLDREQVRETLERIGRDTRNVAGAQVAVAGEWLRAPLWLSGAASPADLQARYVQLFDAQRTLVRSYLDAALGWQQAMTAAATDTAEQVAGTAHEAVNAQTRTAEADASGVREAQQATVEAAHDGATAVRDAASASVEQAREVARDVAERADQPLRPIKGNISRSGERIYHLPGQANYDRVEPEFSFQTEEQARAAGFRPSQR
jgi:hypothetical protein